jgi:hypothetical protein
MDLFLEIWNKYLTPLPSHLATAAKLGIPIGAGCIFFYALSIGYFPRDLTIGDGLLMLVAATCFGMTLLFFLACLFGLGMLSSPIVRLVVKIFISIYNKFAKEKVQQAHDFAPFSWIAIPLALYAGIVIYGFGKTNHIAYYTLPAISILLYMFYSILHSCTAKIKVIQKEKQNKIIVPKDVSKVEDEANLKNGQLFSIVALLFVPLLLGGVSSQLLDAAMRMMHVRIESTAVLVTDRYQSLISLPPAFEYPAESSSWYRYNDAKVLFHGYGKYTVISVRVKDTDIVLEIPNEKIIIIQDNEAKGKKVQNAKADQPKSE